MIYSECKLEIELKKITEIFLSNSGSEKGILNNIKFRITKFNNNIVFRHWHNG